MATIQYVSVPLLSLGSSTTRLNQKLSTSPIARNINPVRQNSKIDRRELQIHNNQAYKNLERTQIIFMNNLIIIPQFIGSRQTHRKRRLHRIDLQENRGELCIEIQREREEAI